MKPRLCGEGRRGQKAIPLQAFHDAMLPNVAPLPITVGVGAFLVRERDLLVVRKTYGPSKGLWTIPSGYVERHESIVQSVEREVKEETNIVGRDRKSTRLNSSHSQISYAVFCLKKKKLGAHA